MTAQEKMYQDIISKYPDCIELIKAMRKDCECNPKIYWDKKLCYIPINATIAITRGNPLDADIMAAAVSWMQHKQIYKFNIELAELLTQNTTGKDTKIPTEILLKLPYNCIYIDTSNINTIEAEGAFIHFDVDINKYRRLELRFLFLDGESEYYPYTIHINDFVDGKLKNYEYVSDAIKATINESTENLKAQETELEKFLIESVEPIADQINKYLQLLFYALAENNDIKVKRVSKKTSKKKIRNVNDVPIKEYIAGDTIFRNISKKNTPNSDHNAKTKNEAEIIEEDITITRGAPKRTHARKGHWHSFWRGKKGTAERELVLHWIPPLIVNPNGENKTTINFYR